jgi:hypothetical protein
MDISQTVVFDTFCAGYRAAQRQMGSGRCMMRYCFSEMDRRPLTGCRKSRSQALNRSQCRSTRIPDAVAARPRPGAYTEWAPTCVSLSAEQQAGVLRAECYVKALAIPAFRSSSLVK